jgi:signal transduction histidine kinase
LIVVQSVAAQGVFDSNPKRARSALESIESEARTMLTEMRRLLGRISPSPGEIAASDPRETLEQLVARVRAAGQPVESLIEPDLRLGDDLEPTVYRCLQEALTNAVKHAPGALTKVVARRAEGRIQIEVENGPATVPNAPRGESGSTAGGRGLAGMRERVAVLGGSFAAGPMPDGGFQLRLSIPDDRKST